MRNMRKFLATLLAIVMCLSLTIPAFAAESATVPNQDTTIAPASTSADDGIMPLATISKSIGPHFVTVATSSSPIQTLYYEVTGKDYNGWVYQINIRCLDQNGHQVGRFDNASGVFASNTLKLFQDQHLYNVYEIQMEIQPRLAVTVTAYYQVTVTW